MRSQSTNVQDRQMDGLTTCNRKTALCTVGHRAVKMDRFTSYQELFTVARLLFYLSRCIMVITTRCRRIVCTVNYCVSKAFHLFSPDTQMIFLRDIRAPVNSAIAQTTNDVSDDHPWVNITQVLRVFLEQIAYSNL